MNADTILVGLADSARVSDTIVRLAPRLGEEIQIPLPHPGFPSRPDVRRQRKRTLMLLGGHARWTAVTEGGEVADECLARALSRELSTECIIVGLYETANAWGRRQYAGGVVSAELFQPIGAFIGGSDDVDWAGDATQECHAWLRSIGWLHGFPLFADLFRGATPQGTAPTSVLRTVIP